MGDTSSREAVMSRPQENHTHSHSEADMINILTNHNQFPVKWRAIAHISMKWQQEQSQTRRFNDWIQIPDPPIDENRHINTPHKTKRHTPSRPPKFLSCKHFILRFIWWSTFFTGGSAGFEILRWFHFWHRYSNLGSMVPLRSWVMETWYVWKWRDRSSPRSATLGRGGRDCARVTGLGRGEWAAPARWGSPWYWKSPAASRKKGCYQSRYWETILRSWQNIIGLREVIQNWYPSTSKESWSVAQELF